MELTRYNAPNLSPSLATTTAFGPFNRRVQLASIIGCAVIGGGSGYLYADSKSLARIEDLSAQSRLRKEYQQLYVVCL